MISYVCARCTYVIWNIAPGNGLMCLQSQVAVQMYANVIDNFFRMSNKWSWHHLYVPPGPFVIVGRVVDWLQRNKFSGAKQMDRFKNSNGRRSRSSNTPLLPIKPRYRGSIPHPHTLHIIQRPIIHQLSLFTFSLTHSINHPRSHFFPFTKNCHLLFSLHRSPYLSVASAFLHEANYYIPRINLNVNGNTICSQACVLDSLMHLPLAFGRFFFLLHQKKI